ncbi:MAG: hypothetical protein IRZ16_11650 [Myxococcaceae bacterium]|nr:hypothetical protein [Myxococcaceae bacterium]
MKSWKVIAAAAALLGATGAYAMDNCPGGDESCKPGQMGTGGSSEIGIEQQEQGAQPLDQEEMGEPQISPEATQPSLTEPTYEESTTRVYRSENKQGAWNNPDLKGVNIGVGAGFEAYTGKLNHSLRAGPQWDATVGVRPWKALGFELGYSGATAEVSNRVASGEGATNGADFVRNGGTASVILSAPTKIAPYVLGGIGLDHYNYRAPDGLFGYQDDTNGNVPVGIGLRTTAGHFTADLRGQYNYLFADQFSPTRSNNVTAGRYGAVLNVGGTF